MYGRTYPIFNYVGNQMSTADFGTWIACITWDQFGIADSGAKHAATQGERYRFKETGPSRLLLRVFAPTPCATWVTCRLARLGG